MLITTAVIGASCAQLTLGEQSATISTEALDTVMPGLEQFRDEHALPSLAVGIVVGDNLVRTYSLGVSDKRIGSPVTEDTLFQIGSISKSFTATLLAMGVDRGLFGWDDPIATHIPHELLSPMWVDTKPTMTVRSSLARRLGLNIAGLPQAGRDVEGVVEMMLDATQGFESPLTKDRLFGWHASLFPTGRSGMRKITVGAWRPKEAGPMQVLSGPIGKEKVHYEAPAAERLESPV